MTTQHGRARSTSSTTNSNQGGGNKKAGLFPSIGIDSWTNVAYGGKPGKCMTLACIRTTRGGVPCNSRPIGSLVVAPRFAC